MQQYAISPKEMLSSLWLHRHIIMQMSKRDAFGRYRGSLIGLAWSFFNPLLMLIVYTFVFSVVFKSRWGVDPNESRTDFALILFVGLTIHTLFADCINRAPLLITSNVNYVKKVIFPLEILPWVTLGSSIFQALINLLVLLIAQLFLNHYFPWTIIFFPIVLIPLVFVTMGFSWFLSSIGVYLRDVSQVTGIFTTV
ncbi:MAG: ABC transporter permease, partial [Desulfobulbus sp.]